MKKFLLSLVLLVWLLILPKTSHAEGEFSSSYNVKYDFDGSGVAHVDEKVTLKNQTDKFFPSSFALTISATNISNVKAKDVDGPLETKVDNQGKKSQITVKFTKQIGGKGKEYSFELFFDSKDFVQKNGDITQVSIPKVGTVEGVGSYILVVSAPVDWSDPAFVTPQPKNQIENGGNILFSFDRDQLNQSGVLMFFGEKQVFDFALSYHLQNLGILPQVQSIGLPSDDAFQHILLKDIEPKPDQVSVDEDGNYRAFFKLNRRQQLNITINGLAQVNTVPERSFIPLSKSEQSVLTSGRTYWDAGNPLIKSKVSEILSTDDKTTAQKMKKLYRYVVSTLGFDYGRLQDNPADRLGSLTALANPGKSLDAEYTDLLIALARSAGIPARQVVGVAFSNSPDLRPLSYLSKNMHSWVEYYDETSGWKAVDPAWESTSGGVDYFSQSLVNHLAAVKRGVSSTEPTSPTDAVITFTDQKFQPQKSVNVFFEVPPTLFSGFPQKATLKLQNTGNIAFPKSNLTLSSKKIQFVGDKQTGQNQLSVPISEIPPFGTVEMNFDLKTGSLAENYSDFILVGFGDQVYYKEVTVVPFYRSAVLLFTAVGIAAVMVALYIVVLGLHLRIGHEGIQFVHPKKKS